MLGVKITGNGILGYYKRLGSHKAAFLSYYKGCFVVEDKGNRVLIIILLSVFCILMWSYISTEQENRISSETDTKAAEALVYENAWIVKLSEGKAMLYENGSFHEFKINSGADMSDVLADVTVIDGHITHIIIKDDAVEGKVLSVSENSMEIEGIGKVGLADNAAVIKNYGELENINVTDVVVGYTTQKIIVDNGEICGIIMDEPVVADTIRVMIMTDDYGSVYHDEVIISAENGFVLEGDGISRSFEAEEVLEVSADTFGTGDRLFVRNSDTEDGRLKLHSVSRQCGNPLYRGMFELVKTAEGIMIINELSLEEYLYAVVPGEMPASYGVEALKAQAVCARSYACRQILDNELGSLGAHVNDSSQYQVYNNMGEHVDAIKAVDETRGQVMTHEGEIVEAYYFSTSCGHTTDAAAVWGGADPGYIKGKLIDGTDVQLILDTEEKFAEFIKNKSFESYDMEYEWYRWEVKYSLNTINNLLKKAGLYDTVGNVEGITVASRETGGIVNMLKVSGDKGSVMLEKEYTIRQFLCPEGLNIVRNDGTTVNNFLLLPSAYFTIEEIYQDGEMSGYHVYGGGFGHGVGMSQKGAKAMVDAGFLYNEVLEYFYNDVSIANCYYDE